MFLGDGSAYGRHCLFLGNGTLEACRYFGPTAQHQDGPTAHLNLIALSLSKTYREGTRVSG